MKRGDAVSADAQRFSPQTFLQPLLQPSASDGELVSACNHLARGEIMWFGEYVPQWMKYKRINQFNKFQLSGICNGRNICLHIIWARMKQYMDQLVQGADIRLVSDHAIEKNELSKVLAKCVPERNCWTHCDCFNRFWERVLLSSAASSRRSPHRDCVLFGVAQRLSYISEFRCVFSSSLSSASFVLLRFPAVACRVDISRWSCQIRIVIISTSTLSHKKFSSCWSPLLLLSSLPSNNEPHEKHTHTYKNWVVNPKVV